MAGRARSKALRECLDSRAADYFDADDTPHTSLDYVCDWVESGKTLKELAADLTTELEHDVPYARLIATLREQYGETTVEERLEASRVRASHPMAEEALSLVDAPADSNVDVSRAASRARTRQWLAEKWNRKAYGQDKGVSVSVSIGSLHLDALRSMPARPAAMAEIVTGSTQHALPASTE